MAWVLAITMLMHCAIEMLLPPLETPRRRLYLRFATYNASLIIVNAALGTPLECRRHIGTSPSIFQLHERADSLCVAANTRRQITPTPPSACAGFSLRLYTESDGLHHAQYPGMGHRLPPPFPVPFCTFGFHDNTPSIRLRFQFLWTLLTGTPPLYTAAFYSAMMPRHFIYVSSYRLFDIDFARLFIIQLLSALFRPATAFPPVCHYYSHSQFTGLRRCF